MQRTMGQVNPTSVCAHKRAVHPSERRVATLPTPQTHKHRAPLFGSQSLTIRRPCVRAHQAWRPVLDDGGHMCLDPWLNLGVVIIDPDIYFGSASQLEGEQNIHVSYVGSELHAAPSICPSNPSHFCFHPHYMTPLRGRICEERVRALNGMPSTSALTLHAAEPVC
jgi:hypothetical protein